MYDDAYNMDRDQQLTTLVNAGQLSEALALLESWHELEPWNGELLMRMAVVHWLAGEPARTLRDLDAYLQVDPENAEAIARRAQALLMMGKREDAEASLAKAEALDPTTPGVLLNRALLYEEHREYVRALESLSAYLEQIPNDHLALARRSHLQRQVGDFAQALADAQACVQMHPEDPETHFAEALAQVTLEHGEQALDACDRCLQVQPSFLPALRLKIDLLADLGRVEEAQTHLQSLQLLEPDSPQTALLCARLATEHDDFSAALSWINRYLDDAPDADQGYYRRGMIYLRMGDIMRALVDFEEFNRLSPAATEGYEQQFMCYLELERFADAVRVGNTAIRLQPQNYRLHYNLAFASLLTGDLEEAKAGFLHTLRLEPDNEDLLLRIYLAFTEHATPQARHAFLRDAVRQLDTPGAMLEGLLAESYLDFGRPEDAWQLAQRLIVSAADRPFPYLLGIKALCLLDRYTEATTLAEQGVTRLPDDGQLRIARALVLRDSGHPEKALQELDIAEQMQADAAEVVRQRALVFGSLGQLTEAIRLLKASLAIESESVDTLFWLGYFQLHRKRYREAIAAADHLLSLAPDAAEGHLIRSAGLRALRRHDEADDELGQARLQDQGMVERLRADPVIAQMLTPDTSVHFGERLRRSVARCWQGVCRTMGYGSG